MKDSEYETNKVFGGAGGKGGGGGSTYEDKADNLISISEIKITDLICEGEIEGFAKNDPLKCIFLDGVPIRNDNEKDFEGPVNFARVDINLKFGTPNQEAVDSTGEISRSVGIGKKVTHALPEGVSYNITDKNVTKARVGIRINRLQKQKLGESGTKVGAHSISFAIYLNGSLFTSQTIKGKTSSGYVKEYEVPVAAAMRDKGYATIKIVKTSDDSTSSLIAEDMQLDYVNEIIEAELNYPYSAVCAMKVDSRSFSQLPRRQYLLKFLKVKLPTNYNPTTRTYDGVWDGTFSDPQWTDNPAWILYDILTNSRYGFGDSISCEAEEFADIWTLYEISKYCDEMVPSGRKNLNGTDILEPRFTCNVAIYERQKISDIVNAFCSIFRGMPIWYSNKLAFTQDRPRDPVAIFTNANILKDGFSYTGSNYMQRYSAAIVYFLDAENYYEKNLVNVEDPEAIKRIGYKEIEIEAFACTSKSQAMRVGKWAIYSSFYESEIISFKAGYDALAVNVGDVISVFDNERYLVRRSGRIVSVNEDRNILTLDEEVYIDPTKENKVHVVVPKGKKNIFELTDSSEIADTNIAQYESRNIVASGNTAYYTKQITLDNALSVGVVALDSAYVVESKSFDASDYFYQDQEEFNTLLLNMQKNFSSDLKAVDLYQSKPKQYRVVSIKDGGDGSYEIAGLEYFAEKYDNVEQGLSIEAGSVAAPPSTWSPSSPSNLRFTKEYGRNGAQNKVTAFWNHSIDKDKYEDAVSYDCYYINYSITGGQTRTYIGNTKDSSIQFYVPDGYFVFAIRTKIQGGNFVTAVYSREVSSPFAFGSLWGGTFNFDSDDNLDLNNLYVEDLALQNGDTTSKFSQKDASFTWGLSDYAFESEISGFGINMYNSSGNFVRRFLTGIEEDQSYSFDIDINKNLTLSGGPYRSFGIKIGIIDQSGLESGFSDTLYVNNPAPQKPIFGTNFTLQSGTNRITVVQPQLNSEFFQTGKTYKSEGHDIAGTLVYYSTGSFTSGNINRSGVPTLSHINVYDAFPSVNTDISVNKGNYYLCIANYDTFGKYDLNYSDIQTISVVGSSDAAPSAPSSLILSSNLISGSNGYLNIRLSGTWNPSSSNDVPFYSFEVRKAGEVDYQTYITTKNFYYINDAEPLKTYEVRVGAMSSIGLVSSYITGGHTVAAYNLSQESTASVPLGGTLIMANGIIPATQSGTFVLCNGAAYPTGLYPDFFNHFGYIYGESNVTGFRVPSGQYNPGFPFMIRLV